MCRSFIIIIFLFLFHHVKTGGIDNLLLARACEKGNREKVEKLLDSTSFSQALLISAFVKAAECKHNDIVYLFLNKKLVDINAQEEDYKRTALIGAVMRNNTSLIASLLIDGANPNLQEKHGCSALFFARSVPAVQLLLKYKADITLTDGDGQTALHQHSSNKKSDILVLQELLTHASHVAPLLIRSRCKKNCSPLHWACLNGRSTEVIDLLVQHGALIDDITVIGVPCTPFTLTLSKGNFDASKILIKHNATIKPTSENHINPLILMIGSNQFDQELAETLVPLVNIDAHDSKDGDDLNCHTALTYAVEQENPQWVQFLLDHGANPDKPYQNKPPLNIACYSGNAAIVELLLKHGANINVTDDEGNTPAHMVALNTGKNKQYTRILQLLIGYNADMTKKNNDGSTPEEITKEKKKTVEYIYDKIRVGSTGFNTIITNLGNDINQLHQATISHDLVTLQKLICKNYINLNDHIWCQSHATHHSVLHHLIQSHWIDGSLLLINHMKQYKIWISLPDQHNDTPLHHAIKLIHEGLPDDTNNNTSLTDPNNNSTHTTTSFMQSLSLLSFNSSKKKLTPDIPEKTSASIYQTTIHPIIYTLVSAGANTNKRNNFQKTPLEMIVNSGHIPLIAYVMPRIHTKSTEEISQLIALSLKSLLPTWQEVSKDTPIEILLTDEDTKLFTLFWRAATHVNPPIDIKMKKKAHASDNN